MVRAARGGQHAAGGGRAGVHRVPLQRLVHGHRDRRARLLRRAALQRPEGDSAGSWAAGRGRGRKFGKRDTTSVHWDGREPLPAL